jgi:hypothetical protein
MWKKTKINNYEVEFFNPDTRLRINFKNNLSSGSRIFIYRKRKSPPKSGKAPTFHKHFDDSKTAESFLRKILQVKNLNFNYLKNIDKMEHKQTLDWFKFIITDFMIKTAKFFRISPMVFESKDAVRLKFEFKEVDSIGSIRLFISSVNNPKIKHSIFLFFRNQNPLNHFITNKDYYLKEIDLLTRKVYLLTLTSWAFDEAIREKQIPNYGNLPIGFRRIDEYNRFIKKLKNDNETKKKK